MSLQFPSGATSTTKQIQDLKDQLSSMKKSNQMKDDTIAFLQKEKESLMREVSHHQRVYVYRGSQQTYLFVCQEKAVMCDERLQRSQTDQN